MATYSIDRIADANGNEFVFSNPAVSNKLDKNGDGSDVTVGFTEAENRTNIATGSKLSTLFGQIRKWFADLKALAFKDKVGTSDVESGTYPIDISGNAAIANALATPRKIDGVEFDGSGDVIHYGECNTAATVQAKVIACPGFVLTTAARIIIKFTQNNNFREPTFNVNNTGAVPVRYFGSLLPSANFLRKDAVYQFIYDGTNYCFVGNFDSNNYAYQTALANDAEYPVLCKNNANNTAENNFVRYASGITMNPSTNKITASGGFVGNLSGNAATADSATTASSADIATSTSSGSIPGGADLNSYNAANRNYLCNANDASTVTNKPSGASGAFELEVIRGTGSTCVQVYYSRDNVNFNYIRKCTGLNDGTWTGWVKLIDSSDVISPNYSAATLAYDASGESLLFNLSKVSVYGEIVSTSYCQLKIVPKSGSIRTDRSVIKSFNSNFDSFRIYNYPWSSSPGSNAYTPNIQYDNNNIGTIDIDLVTTQTVVIHLTVWYIADTAAGLYRFYIVEEVKT